MPPVQAPSPFPLADGVPVRFGVYGPTTTSAVNTSVRNPTIGQTWVLTGLDFTASEAQPVQCFFAAQLWLNGNTFGPTFYYDSQSAGEGLGVWFSWRGAITLNTNDAVGIVATSAANIVWGGVLFGVQFPG